MSGGMGENLTSSGIAKRNSEISTLLRRVREVTRTAVRATRAASCRSQYRDRGLLTSVYEQLLADSHSVQKLIVLASSAEMEIVLDERHYIDCLEIASADSRASVRALFFAVSRRLSKARSRTPFNMEI